MLFSFLDAASILSLLLFLLVAISPSPLTTPVDEIGEKTGFENWKNLENYYIKTKRTTIGKAK